MSIRGVSKDGIERSQCRAEMEAVMQCVIREPAKHWECSEQQIAAIKDGFCQREQLEFIR